MSDIDMKYILKAYDKANEQKIKSPYAKYISGKLYCVACNVMVKSDALWANHIKATSHIQRAAIYNKQKTKPQPKEEKKEEPKPVVEGKEAEEEKEKIKGFFDDKTQEKKALGVNLKQEEAKQNEQDLQDFLKGLDEDEANREQLEIKATESTKMMDDFMEQQGLAYRIRFEAMLERKQQGKRTLDNEDLLNEVDDMISVGMDRDQLVHNIDFKQIMDAKKAKRKQKAAEPSRNVMENILKWRQKK